ncbi:hypothetical protein LEQ41_02155 [Streptococcus agalactiae]|nr:hypothetical protein [Streptococcus agalactiae]
MRIYWSNVTNVLENINRKRLSYLLSLYLVFQGIIIVIVSYFAIIDKKEICQ